MSILILRRYLFTKMASCVIISGSFLKKGVFTKVKKLKKNRIFSFAIICVVYIIAIIVGILIAKAMTGKVWVNFLVADLAATVIVFIFGTLFRNSSIYDPYWSVIPVITVFVLTFSTAFNFLRLLMLIAITVWGVRLTANWAIRFGSLRREDWRYKAIRKSTGSMFPIINFLGIHLFPTLVVFLCMLPVTATFSTDLSFSPFSIIFFLIAIGAVVIETYADYHMNLFKKDLADGYVSGCCRYGLWRNARHPNYFGEILFWWSIYFMMLISIPDQWYLFIGALVNTLMFAFVSIPLAEARISRKGGYRRYKKSTHLLLPIPKLR